MSLHYILGGAGTGKSTLLMQRLIRSSLEHPEQRHIMLVPEQYTMQTQRNIVRMHPNHAVMNIDILSFERLAYRVLSELGQEDLTILTSMGRNMILRQVCAEHEGELQVFRRSLRRPGFISRLMNMISEFYQYGITEEQLRGLMPELAAHPLLVRKMEDLSVFYRAADRMKGENAIAAEELLSVLERLLPQSEFLDQTRIAVDCFTGFTPVQMRILRQMFGKAESVEMAFLLPEEEWKNESREEDLFHMSQAAVFQCDALAKEAGIPRTKEYCKEDLRHRRKGELAFLAGHFLRDSAGKWESVPEHIRAFSYRNPREEAEAAAKEIRRRVMKDGLHYRDIAVVSGDPEEYRPFLEHYFRQFDIPAFMDRRKGIQGNPLAEYMQSAVETVVQDMTYDSVFRFLKCGIEILDPEDRDILENYVLAAGIRGRARWDREWIPEEQDSSDEIRMEVEHLNELRARIMHVLAPLNEQRNLFRREEDIRVRICVKERVEVLRRLLDVSGAGEQMEHLAELLEAEGRADTAEEYRKTESYLRDLLDEMEALLGEECLSLQEFSDILDAGLAEAKLGLIPTSADQVQVGDVMRTRLGEIRQLIVLGFNEGLIPGTPVSGGILSETERALLEEHGLVLAPTAEHVSNQERFYLYRLMTAPSEDILITASRMACDGTARKPSHLWNRLVQIFPALELQEIVPGGQCEILETGQAWRTAASALPSMKYKELKEGNSLAQCLRDTDPGRMDRLIRAAFEPKHLDSIGRTAAAALYGKELAGSITRLEQYASCAYAHFLSYGLALAEREDGSFRQTDRGNYFHRILELFFLTCRDRKLDVRNLSPEDRNLLISEALEMAEKEGGLKRMDESASDRYLVRRWRILAEDTVNAICEMLSEEEFVPREFELRFHGGNSSAMKVDLGQGEKLTLRGKIDRLDTMQGSEGLYLRVVDYKTGSTELDLNLLEQGLQLQLPIYLSAVEEYAAEKNPGTEVIPGGICYYHVAEPLLDMDAADADQVPRDPLLKKLQLKGLILDEPEAAEGMAWSTGEKAERRQFTWMCDHVRRKAGEFGRQILDGDIRTEPYQYKDRTGCAFCAFREICGFNARRAGNHYRVLRPKEKQAIWEELEEEYGSEMDR